MTAPHEQRETPAAPRPRAAILGALRWVAAIGLLALVGRKLWSQWSLLREHPLSFSSGSTALSLALICVFLLLCAEAWRLLLLELGTPVPRPAAFRIVYLSNLAKYLPGGVWNLVGRVALCHEANIAPVRASISVLLDLACQVVAATLLALPMLAGRAQLGHPALLWLVGALMIAAMHPRVMNAVIGLTRLVGRPLPELRSGTRSS